MPLRTERADSLDKNLPGSKGLRFLGENMKNKFICQECGKEYFRSPSNSRNSHYCSNACRARVTSRNLTDDLTGQRFGRWTVIARAENGNGGETKWTCRCDCGNEAAVYKSSLVGGASKSCGCYKFEVNQRQASKLFAKPINPGQRFMRLVVQREAGRKGGQIAYLCQCDCGNSVTVPSNSLRSGNTKSCGCYNIDQIKKRRTTHGLTNLPFFERWRHQIRSEADEQWTLEMSTLLFHLQPRCVVCQSDRQIAVDHVRPLSKGYGLKPGNVVVLCKSCNSIKHNRDLSQLPQDWQEKITRAAQEFLDAWNTRVE